MDLESLIKQSGVEIFFQLFGHDEIAGFCLADNEVMGDMITLVLCSLLEVSNKCQLDHVETSAWEISVITYFCYELTQTISGKVRRAYRMGERYLVLYNEAKVSEVFTGKVFHKGFHSIALLTGLDTLDDVVFSVFYVIELCLK